MGINLFDSSQISLPFGDVSFTFDPTSDAIGMITDSLIYINNLISGRQALYSFYPEVVPDKRKEKPLSTLANAWYETAKYLLYHNHKKTSD